MEGTGAAPNGVTVTSSTSTAFARVFDARGTFKLQATGAASWRLTAISTDPFERYTPLQDNPAAYGDGALMIVGAEVGAPDTPAAALLELGGHERQLRDGRAAWLELDTMGLSLRSATARGSSAGRSTPTG